MKKSILFAFFAILFISVLHAQQPTREDLQKQKKLLEQEINELNALQESISKNKKQSLKQLAVVQTKIRKREQLINSINKEIRRVDDQLYTDEIEIYRLKKELDTLKQQYAKSIVFAYKNRGSYEYLNFLFSAKDFNDAVTRLTYLKSYRKYRETQVETINKTQQLLQSAVETLNNTKNEKKQVLVTQNVQLKALEQDKKENAAVIQQLKDQEKDVQAQLRKRDKQRQDLNKAIAAAIKREIDEANRKAKAAAEAAAKKTAPSSNNPTVNNNPKTSTGIRSDEPNAGVASMGNSNRSYNVFESTPEGLTQSINFENNKGRLPWPVNGGVVTHEFGVEQVNKIRVVNDGIFISVPVGANVKCVADGEVAAIIPLDDDDAVMVKHGKYFTVYNKLTGVSVSKGQKVNAGTVVGKAAADLSGSGEIEFRVMNGNNQYINPASWLKQR
ncbi:MAG: peptidoglycan DD-metalloendopeptidase family protein [Sphingobacteriia bacterium]|nr:peptidoglycan DD-metalloendopeptidase family protein [Sphingobacteriia bacterium]